MEDSGEIQKIFTEAIEELADVISKLKNMDKMDKISHKIADPRKWNGDQKRFCNWWSMVKVWTSYVKWTNNEVWLMAILSHFEGKAMVYTCLLVDHYTAKENLFEQGKDRKLTTLLYGIDTWSTTNDLEHEIREHYQIQVLMLDYLVGFKLVYTRLIGLVYLLGSNLALPATSYAKLCLVGHKSCALLSFQPVLPLAN